MFRNFSQWLYRRFRNFLLYSIAAFGLPMYIVLTLLRSDGIAVWVRLFDVFSSLCVGLIWGAIMWMLLSRRRAKALEKRLLDK